MPHMIEEIREQPEVVERAVASGAEAVARLVQAMRDNDVRSVMIAARGTSDHAATYAKYLLEIVAGVPTSLAAPSVVTLYDGRLRLGNTLVLGISQSGQGTDVVQVLSSARASGAITACITNCAGSPITEVSDHVLLCNAGEEKAVAATKTYTSSLALVALLAGTLSERKDLLEELRRVPDLLRSTLELEGHIERSAERYRYIRECAVVARGINQATALEAALKMVETSYVVAKPYSGADFQHGPIAMVEDGFPCFVYAPTGRAYAFMLETALKIKERGGEMIVTAHDREILDLGRTRFEVPVQVSEVLSPLVYIVPGQLFAYYLSRTRGGNPDAPRGLHKVTLTS